MAAVLSTSGPTVAPVNSLNGEIGVPLTVCRIDAATRFLVAEMGARGIGHISYLTEIAPPQVAIVLNVGLAHVGEFGSVDNIALAKSELPRSLPPTGWRSSTGTTPGWRPWPRGCLPGRDGGGARGRGPPGGGRPARRAGARVVHARAPWSSPTSG